MKIAVVALAIILLTRAYIKPNRVVGSSDAPTYLIGDLILVNELAYDLRFPYTNLVIFSHAEPQRGEVVQFRQPGNDQPVFKRVVGCPGDVIQLANHHLTINSIALDYSPVHLSLSEEISLKNHIGSVTEIESGSGTAHLITHSPATDPERDSREFMVPEGTFYMLGDNRGNSYDSRDYGPIPRTRILGRVSDPIGAGKRF